MSKNNVMSKILAMEMELNLAEQDLDALNTDLAYLEKTYLTMDYSVNFIRKEARIVSLSEFRKTVLDMSYILTKIRSIRNQILKLETSIQNKVKGLDFYYKMYETELYPEEKVLEFRRVNE